MGKKVFAYICKNFGYIFPFTLLSGVIFAGMFDYSAFVFVSEKIFTGKIGDIGFDQFFRALSILNFSSWYYALFSLAGILLICMTLAMELAFVEKHMRIGKRTWNGLWGKINDNFVSTFIQIAIYLVSYEIWAVLASAILYAIVHVFASIVVAQYIFVILLFFFFVYALLYLVHIFYLWLPCSEITGFTFYESLKYSTQLVGKVRGFLIGSYAVTLGVCGVILVGLAVWNLFMPVPVLTYGVAAVECVYLFTVFTIGQEVVYFETDQLERADLPKVY